MRMRTRMMTRAGRLARATPAGSCRRWTWTRAMRISPAVTRRTEQARTTTTTRTTRHRRRRRPRRRKRAAPRRRRIISQPPRRRNPPRERHSSKRHLLKRRLPQKLPKRNFLKRGPRGEVSLRNPKTSPLPCRPGGLPHLSFPLILFGICRWQGSLNRPRQNWPTRQRRRRRRTRMRVAKMERMGEIRRTRRTLWTSWTQH
mmetsp:Transcript_36160/g.108241  ORF Transcript_36160/g.108241 Transcript_36160/m.108241 type:complete len:201 (+) Transcript_36160:182-784(+)